MKKYYHVVLEKDGHYYYEIFEDLVRENQRYAKLLYSSFYRDEVPNYEFKFNSFLDLRHNNPDNKCLLEERGELRKFFLCAREAIDFVKAQYQAKANKSISYILQQTHSYFE